MKPRINLRLTFIFLVFLISGILAAKFSEGFLEKSSRPSRSHKAFKCNHKFRTNEKYILDQAVPKCPQKNTFTLNTSFPPGAIYVGYTPGKTQLKLIDSLIKILSSFKSPPKLIVMIPRHETEAAYDDLKKYMSVPFEDFLRIFPTASDETIWAQDYFEAIYFEENGEIAFMDLPYMEREGEAIPSSIALSCSMNYIKQPEIKKEFIRKDNADYGGNILPLFPGIIAIGESMSIPLKEHIKTFSNDKVIELDVKWLETGHVDEIISLIPDFSTSRKCPTALAFASPDLAIKIIKDTPKDHADFRIFELTEDAHTDNESLPIYISYSNCASEINSGAIKNSKCSELIKANKRYAQIINENINKIIEYTKETSDCKNIKLIEFPVIFAPEKIRNYYGKINDNSFSLNPNSINSVSIGKFLIITKQVFQPFQKHIEATIKELNVTPVWQQPDSFHFLNGGLHCAMNITRMCR